VRASLEFSQLAHVHRILQSGAIGSGHMSELKKLQGTHATMATALPWRQRKPFPAACCWESTRMPQQLRRRSLGPISCVTGNLHRVTL